MSLFAPRDYADRLADAMGEGLSAEAAKQYAGGAGSLRDFIGKTPKTCTCVEHPVYGVEIDDACPLHGSECDHAELDHNICLLCGEDCTDREVERAKNSKDGEDR